MKPITFKILVLAILLIIPTMASSEPIPENVTKCIAFISKFDANQNIPIGTGFFIGHKYKEKVDSTFLFLVTAKHVLFDENGNKIQNLQITMNEKNTGHSKNFNIINSNAWFFHEKADAVDIAVQPLAPRGADFLYVGTHLFVTNNLITTNNISVGDELFYMGLLSYHTGKERISPIVRFGKLALVSNEETVDGKFYHYIDAGNIPGHSGSPVFLWATASRNSGNLVAGPRIFGLYGIVSGMLEYSDKLKVTVPVKTYSQAIPQDTRNGGITAIVPVSFLMEIIESEKMKAYIGLKTQN